MYIYNCYFFRNYHVYLLWNQQIWVMFICIVVLLGMSSSQLTFIFSEGLKPPTRWWFSRFRWIFLGFRTTTTATTTTTTILRYAYIHSSFCVCIIHICWCRSFSPGHQLDRHHEARHWSLLLRQSHSSPAAFFWRFVVFFVGIYMGNHGKLWETMGRCKGS